MGFSEAQKTAICHREGPMMVLAGPGSGKTTVITHRVRFLTEHCGIRPSDILVITFTRAAAAEMKERYESLAGHSSGVAFGTFHSVFFRILKLAYRYTADNIVREEQQQTFLRELLEKEEMEPEDENEFIASVLTEISSVKGERIDLSCYYSRNCPDEIFRRLYTGYENRMRAEGLIDFDDMMVMCLELFLQRKDILSAWQRRYRYILIDEFQDINRIQYEIVRMLAEPERNIFIVGDDDQSIYRFRGARPEIMLGFEKDYPEAKRVLLDVNYRCTAELSAASLRLIEWNKKRFPKAIRTAGARGKGVITRKFPEPAQENRTIAEELLAYAGAGIPYGEMAVLYRTNSCPRFLMEKLMEYNIPFCTRDTVPNLYDHWIASDILTYIRLAMGSRSRSDFLHIMNRPNRYISRDSLPEETVSFERWRAYYQEKDWIADRIENLEYDLKAVSRMSPLAAVNYIRQGMGYDKYLEEYARFRRMKPEELLETADQLRESAASYRTFEDWFSHIREYGEELKRQIALRRSEADAVTLATMHSSKGLEFSVVYILDANEGITPHSRAVLPEDVEEERRLFYVAMTRAKRRLHVYYVTERYHKPAECSRFVKEYLGIEKSDRR
ncbi:MAG: ATP-dependent helicase [Clostridium sp.]|nr:ATP-dependent helicase [Clostridium sp.]